jgi:hypothetical protein
MTHLGFDAEGRFCFAVDPIGWAHVYIESDHGTSVPIACNLQPGAVFDGLLWPIRPEGGPGSATVTVVDTTGKPFCSDSVWIQLGFQRFEESTDPLGVAYFPSLPEEAGVVSVTTKVPVVISGHTSIRVVSAPFLTPGTIRGRTDPLLPDITVSLREGDPVQPEAGGGEDQAAGEEPDECEFKIGPEKPTFSFTHSPALECRLTAWSADRAWWGSTVSQASAGETRDVAIKLVRTAPVSGMIELDGKPFTPTVPTIVVAFEGEHRFLFRLAEGAFRGVVVPGTYTVRILDEESVGRNEHAADTPGYAGRTRLAALPGISVARELIVAAGTEVTLSSRVATGTLTLKPFHRGTAVPSGLGRVFSREDLMLVAENVIDDGTLVLAHRLLGRARFPAGSYTIHIHDRVGTFLGSGRFEVTAGRAEEVSIDLDQLVPVTITATLPDGAPAVWLEGSLSSNGEAHCPVYDRDALGFLAPEGRLEGWIAAEGFELQHFGPVAIERGKESRFAARLEAGGRLFVPCTHWPRLLPKVVPCEGAPCAKDVRFEYILTAGLKDLFAPEIHAKLFDAGRGWALATRTLRAGTYRVAYCIDGTVGERVVEISVGKGTVLFP